MSHSHSIALQKALVLTGCLLMACQSPAGAESWNLSDVPTSQLLAQVSRQYLVYVRGESNEMLEQVRRVAPDAYIDQYKGRRVIKAGTFYDRQLAKRREREIEALYIRAEVARIEGRYNPRTDAYFPNSSRIEGRANPSTGYFTGSSATRRTSDNDYFVAIPAPERDLPVIAEQVRVLGVPAEGVEDRDKPRGYHVLVGPFADRGTAERWNRYLIDLGLENARVYYGR
ncbi:hypothetical protein H6F73_06235 [Microcoleus sp. FACHB-68]|nr:hypothetical protein [Microcoleus sp. FACHB-68]